MKENKEENKLERRMQDRNHREGEEHKGER